MQYGYNTQEVSTDVILFSMQYGFDIQEVSTGVVPL